MSKHILAIDIDLGNVTVVSNQKGVICHQETPGSWENLLVPSSRLPEPDILLVELAGPVMHHQESHSHRRWMIYNALVGARIARAFKSGGCRILVSASTQWTAGYTEEKRHAIAGMLPLKYTKRKVKKKGVMTEIKVPVYAEPHDIRECRCMIDFYLKRPKEWVTMDEYLQALVDGPKKKGEK